MRAERAAELTWRLGVWLGAWALVPHASFAALTLALVASTLLLRASAARWRRWPADLRVAIGAFGIALGVATLAPQTDALVRREGLDGLVPRARAGWALERTPSVFPTRLVPGERHFVHAPGAERVTLAFGEAREERSEGVSLGHGLFAIDAPRAIEGAAGIAIDGTSSLTLDPPSAPRPQIGCASEGRIVVLDVPRSSRVRVVDADGRLHTQRHAEPVRACVVVGGALVWGTDGAVFDESRRWESGPVRAMVAAGDVIVMAVGNVLRFVRRTGRGFEPLRDVAIGLSPVHLVANDDTVFAARGGQIVRVAMPTLGQHGERASEVGRTTLPGDVIAMAVRGTRLAVATNGVDAVDPNDAEVGNHYVEDAVLELDARTLAVTRVHRTARRTRRQDHPGAVDAGLLPRALAFDGEKLLVAFAGSGELGAIDDELRVGRLPRALGTPVGLVVDRPGARVVLAEAEGRLGIWRRDSWQVIELASPSRGARAFHAPTRSGLACASCHLEGGDATHRLAPTHGSPTHGVPRAAPELANLALTPPYFRNAAYGSLDALIDDGARLFGGWREDVDVDALVAWLEARARGGTTTFDLRSGRDDGPSEVAPASLREVRDGLDAFVEAGCATCHAFPAFTDRRTRTGVELGRARRGIADTPSLVGLARASRDRFADGEGVHRVDAADHERIARFLETL